MLRIFRHYVPKSLVILSTSEAAIFLAAIYFAVTSPSLGFNPTEKLLVGEIWTKALAYALVMMLSMVGNVGTGKTTLVSTLFRGLERENIVAAQVVTTQLQADDLLRMVAASFGLAYQRVGKATLLTSLESFFRACVREGKRVLLVVDEAQNLPRRSIEELRMLSNFQLDGRALLQSFLLGQREFRSTMRSEGFEQLRQRVIAAYHLKPLRFDETRGYIEHRLLTAGWQGDPLITDETYDGIYKFTEGVPRRINTLCDRLLLFGCLEELHTIDFEALKAVSQDIIEEQTGGDIEPEPLSMLSSVSSPGSRDTEQSPPTNGKSNAATVEKEDKRMASLESSMVELATTMREELKLLREAMVRESDRGARKDDK